MLIISGCTVVFMFVSTKWIIAREDAYFCKWDVKPLSVWVFSVDFLADMQHCYRIHMVAAVILYQTKTKIIGNC